MIFLIKLTTVLFFLYFNWAKVISNQYQRGTFTVLARIGARFGVWGLFLEINGRFVLICAKILEDLFFFDQRMDFSSIFEHKRGAPGKGKTENFGCFMELFRSPDSPNGELKTKKHPSFSGVFYT